MVERLDHGSNKPKVSLHFTSDTMMRLIQKKLSFERALITREVRVEGPLMEGLRVGGIFSRFLKDHPYSEDFEPGNGNN
jgi:putative sterol carrier protein